MSSSIVFHGYHHDGSNGLIEHILDLCLIEFDRIEGCQYRPELRAFLQTYRDCFFSGLYVFLDEDDLQSPAADATFLADLFARVFELLQEPGSELTDHGRRTVARRLSPLVERLRRYAAGTLPHGNEER